MLQYKHPSSLDVRASAMSLFVKNFSIRSDTLSFEERGVSKLDLEKAYDRMEWPFIEETLRDASVLVKMINIIMGLLPQALVVFSRMERQLMQSNPQGDSGKATLSRPIFS